MQTDKKQSRRDAKYCVSASKVYARQNRIIHKAFMHLSLPYSENKTYWTGVLSDITTRITTGLSDMTLFERHKLITHLKQKKAASSNPYIPESFTNWKTNNPDIFAEIKTNPRRGFPGRPDPKNFIDPDKGKMLTKIEALLAEAKRPWAYVHKMSKHMAKVERIEWCSPKQIHDIVSALVIDAKRHGRKVNRITD